MCNNKISMNRDTFYKILDFFWHPCTDDSIPMVAEIKEILVKEFPDEFEIENNVNHDAS